MPVRTSRIDLPVRRASPVISPSRGPGPKRPPMYIPVAMPQSRIAPTSDDPPPGSGRRCGEQPAATGSSNDPTSTTLLSVPSPGRCRSGIQSSSTSAPTMMTMTPIASPVRRRCPGGRRPRGPAPDPPAPAAPRTGRRGPGQCRAAPRAGFGSLHHSGLARSVQRPGHDTEKWPGHCQSMLRQWRHGLDHPARRTRPGRAAARLADSPGPVYAGLARRDHQPGARRRIAPRPGCPPSASWPQPRPQPSHRDRGLRRAAPTAFLASRTGSGSVSPCRPADRSRHPVARAAAAVDRARSGPDRGSPDAGSPRPGTVDLSCAAFPAPPGLRRPRWPGPASGSRPTSAAPATSPAGLPELRAAVAHRFRDARRRDRRRADPGHATVRCTRWTCCCGCSSGPGDRVLTELPTYPGALDAMRASGARVVAGADGARRRLARRHDAGDPAPDRAAAGLPHPRLPQPDRRARRPRPSAATCCAPPGRPAPPSWSTSRSSNSASSSPTPPTAAIDPSVITVGSLSKPVWGGLRVGWIRASTELVQRLAALRASIDMGRRGARSARRARRSFAGWTSIMPAGARRCSAARDALLAASAASCPSGASTVRRAACRCGPSWTRRWRPRSRCAAAQSGVIVVPGSRFGVDGTLERFLRLPVLAARATARGRGAPAGAPSGVSSTAAAPRYATSSSPDRSAGRSVSRRSRRRAGPARRPRPRRPEPPARRTASARCGPAEGRLRPRHRAPAPRPASCSR